MQAVLSLLAEKIIFLILFMKDIIALQDSWGPWHKDMAIEK